MPSITLLSFALLGAFILYKLLSVIALRFKHASLAKRLQCKSVPNFHRGPLPLGLSNIQEMLKARTDGVFPMLQKNRCEMLGEREGKPLFTMEMYVLGGRVLWTCDPKNIQAILATQFKEFELGPVRRGTFNEL